MASHVTACLCHGIGTPLTVDGCADDAAGIACSLTAVVEAPDTDMTEGGAVAQYAHGRRGARLNGYDGGLAGEEPMMMTTPQEESLTQTLGEERWHPEMQRRRYQAGSVGGGGQIGTQPLVDEIGHTLRRGGLTTVGLQPTLTLQFLLQGEHGEWS